MTATDQIRTELRRWVGGKIDKFEFYANTKAHPAALVAKVADIPLDVVKDRRRYLDQLKQQLTCLCDEIGPATIRDPDCPRHRQ